MILSGGTPRSSTDWISALLAQSKPQPREARMASSTGLLLHLMAVRGQGEGRGKEGEGRGGKGRERRGKEGRRGKGRRRGREGRGGRGSRERRPEVEGTLMVQRYDTAHHTRL